MISKNTQDTKILLNSQPTTCYTISRLEESEYLALWQNLTITDDFMFGKITQDREICTELLDRGQNYDHLSPSYIIFICSFDLFQRGLHIYEFKNYCTQDRDMELGDEATKIFLNARGQADDISPHIKEFLDYVAGIEYDAPSPFIDKLKQALSCAKQNRQWRRQHMNMYFREMDIRADALKEGRAEGLTEGREIGRQETCTEMVLSMLQHGADREFIKTVASLSDEELDHIIAESK